jgi:DnaD/phage-associated family protein
MIKIFNGKWRGLGDSGFGFGMILDFQFREYLMYFKGAQLHVFMAIALHCDDNGVSWPSYDTLEKETGYSRASIAKALDDLCKLEIDGQPVLARLRIRDNAGRYVGSNHYLIFPNQVDIQSLETKLPDDQSLVNPTLDKTNFGETILEDKPLIKDKPNLKMEEEAATPASVFAAFEQEIGPLTPMISEELQDLIEDHTEQWVIASFREASTMGKRSLGYCKAILKRWKVEGYGSEFKPASKNGGGKPTQPGETWDDVLKELREA